MDGGFSRLVGNTDGGFAKLVGPSNVPNVSGMVNLPPKTAAGQIIDNVLSDPTLYQELRKRNIITNPARQMQGMFWIAKKDGPCQKAVGWEFDDAGYLRERECGVTILQGTRCWRQGWKFYGYGCHPKGIERLSKLFIGEHLLNHSEFVNNLPDRRDWLRVIENLWDQEVTAGNLRGAWEGGQENEERKKSRQEIEARILHAMRQLKKGVKLPAKLKPEPKARVIKATKPPAPPLHLPTIEQSKITKRARVRDSAVEVKIETGKPAVTVPLATRTEGKVVAIYRGTDAEAKAKKHVGDFAHARTVSNLKPLIAKPEGKDAWVVINPDAYALDPRQHVTKGK